MAQMPNAQWPFRFGASPFHMKGLVYRSFMRFAERHVGRERFLNALNDPELRAFATQTFVPSNFYDCGPVVALNRVRASLMGISENESFRLGATQQAETDLRGAYSLVLAVLSQSRVLQALSRLTQVYFDWGRSFAEPRGPKYWVAGRSGVPQHLIDWSEVGTQAFTQVALMRTRAKNLSFDVKRFADGNAHEIETFRFEMHMTWD
jgi:hypothetical protein